jgi:hypothetical protein
MSKDEAFAYAQEQLKKKECLWNLIWGITGCSG